MADAQRIYPVPPAGAMQRAERPTRPLVPRSTSIPSEKGNPTYNNYPPLKPPRSRSSCFCRVICCIFCLLITILVTIGILGVVFYFVLHPKAPNFSVNKIRITDFRINTDLSLYTKFDVRIAATNPNEKIGIYYEKGGKMTVLYSKTELCHGSLPAFYQAPQNKTVLDVSLSGQNQFGNTLMSALMQQQQSGNIPLDLKVDQPVSIKPGSLKLGKVRFLAHCKLIVDSLSSSNLVSIKKSSCSIRVKL
uniref:Late embryogenesis abundant protein LEA-2 subgroup domain-containing protein n=1 Tax=Opuntia streptacantha TaxID=393608 RepID=A0A7C8ZJ81_OPUST